MMTKSPVVYSGLRFQYHINDQSWLVVDRRALVRVKSEALENLPLLELLSLGLSRVHLFLSVVSNVKYSSAYLHPHNAIVPGGGKHARVFRIPRDRIDTTFRVSLQYLHEGSILSVPYINLRIYTYYALVTMITTPEQLTYPRFR